MKRLRRWIQERQSVLIGYGLLLLIAAGLLTYKLTDLLPGISLSEQATARSLYGWHGIYQRPLYLPLAVIRSITALLGANHHVWLLRLPSVICILVASAGLLTLLRIWHGNRCAYLISLAFICNDWVLHVGRLATNDALYIAVSIMLLLVHVLLQRRFRQPLVWYGSLAVWGLSLYIPGVFWLLLFDTVLLRKSLVAGWQQFGSLPWRLTTIALGVWWLPLLLIDLLRTGQLAAWLGLPNHFGGISKFAKQLVAVPLHLWLRGPEYPQLWLGRTPILAVFILALSLLGVAFYLNHYNASRSRLLIGFFVIGTILVALQAAVSLSLLVPLLFVTAAMGFAYLLQRWQKVFPANPLAERLAVGLLITAVAVSCLYGLSAYFIAWPHNTTAHITFSRRL